MNRKSLLIACTVISLSFLLLSWTEMEGVKGWYLVGSSPKSYQIGVESNTDRGGKVAFLKSIEVSQGFGSLMQSFDPGDYKGKRVRLTGFIKSKDVSDWAGMWFRIDGEKTKMLGFDNMQSRPIKGSTDWKKYQIVLDVPTESLAIAYGVLLSGQGTIMLDDISFEVVDKSVPLTGSGKTDVSRPVNTNFEDSDN